MGDNLSTAYFATQLADLNQKDAIAVVGCGTVGLLAIQWARSLGVERVLAIEPNSHRRQMAGQLGAITASDLQQFRGLTEEATEGHGVDSVMEFVGLPDAQRTAFEVVRPGGTLASIGCHCTPHLSFSPSEAYDKNLTYRTGRCSARHYMETVQQMSGQFKHGSLLVHYSPVFTRPSFGGLLDLRQSNRSLHQSCFLKSTEIAATLRGG